MKNEPLVTENTNIVEVSVTRTADADGENKKTSPRGGSALPSPRPLNAALLTEEKENGSNDALIRVENKDPSIPQDSESSAETIEVPPANPDGDAFSATTAVPPAAATASTTKVSKTVTISPQNIPLSSASVNATPAPQQHQQQAEKEDPIEILNSYNGYSFYPKSKGVAVVGGGGGNSSSSSAINIPRKHYETVSVEDLIKELIQRQDDRLVTLNIRQKEENSSRRAVLSQALRTLQVREAAVEATEMSAVKLLLFDERIQRKEKEVEQRELQVNAKDIENQKTERELRAREREQQILYDKKVEPLAAREFQITRKEEDLKTIESALEARVNSHAMRINAEEDAMRNRERTLRENEIRLTDQLEASAKAQSEYQTLHQLWQKKYKQLMLEEEQLNAREKEIAAREVQLFNGEKAMLATKQKLSLQESELVAQKAELQAAIAQLEIQRVDLRQKALKHDAAVNRLVDAKSELTYHEQNIDKKVHYTDKIYEEAASVYQTSRVTLEEAEAERRAAIDLKDKAEAKLKAAQARERQLLKAQQGLEKQKTALAATNMELMNRETRLMCDIEEMQLTIAQLQQQQQHHHRSLSSPSNSLLLLSHNNKSSNNGGAAPSTSAFFNNTLSGFNRLGTASMVPMSATSAPALKNAAAADSVGSVAAAGSPINMQLKNAQVADLYSQPLSRKIVHLYANRPLPQKQGQQQQRGHVGGGAASNSMTLLPGSSSSGKNYNNTNNSSSSRAVFSNSAPASAFSSNPNNNDNTGKGNGGRGLLLPPIPSGGGAAGKKNPPSANDDDEKGRVVSGKAGQPLSYDNPFGPSPTKKRTSSASSNPKAAPSAVGRGVHKNRGESEDTAANFVERAARIAEETHEKFQKDQGGRDDENGEGKKNPLAIKDRSAQSSRAPSSHNNDSHDSDDNGSRRQGSVPSSRSSDASSSHPSNGTATPPARSSSSASASAASLPSSLRSSSSSSLSPSHSSDSSDTTERKRDRIEQKALRRKRRAEALAAKRSKKHKKNKEKPKRNRRQQKKKKSNSDGLKPSELGRVAAKGAKGNSTSPSPPPPPSDDILTEYLKTVAYFWAEEKRCNALEIELDEHLDAIKSGGERKKKPTTAMVDSSNADDDEVSWTVEGGPSAKKNTTKANNRTNTNTKKNGASLPPPLLSPYRLLPSEVIHECVYVKGAQRDAKQEFNYLIRSVVITPSATSDQLNDGEMDLLFEGGDEDSKKRGRSPRGKKKSHKKDSGIGVATEEELDAKLVYMIASSLYRASLQQSQNDSVAPPLSDPLAIIVTQAFQRALKLQSQRTRWLEACIKQIEAAITQAEEDEDAEENENNNSRQQQKAAEKFTGKSSAIEKGVSNNTVKPTDDLDDKNNNDTEQYEDDYDNIDEGSGDNATRTDAGGDVD